MRGHTSLSVQFEFYETIRAYCLASGITVGGFVERCVMPVIEEALRADPIMRDATEAIKEARKNIHQHRGTKS